MIKKQILEWFGMLMDENEISQSQAYVNDTLTTFLTSSLNVELVHVILESITKHSKGQGIVKDFFTYLDYKEYFIIFNHLL